MRQANPQDGPPIKLPAGVWTVGETDSEAQAGCRVSISRTHNPEGETSFRGSRVLSGSQCFSLSDHVCATHHSGPAAVLTRGFSNSKAGERCHSLLWSRLYRRMPGVNEGCGSGLRGDIWPEQGGTGDSTLHDATQKPCQRLMNLKATHSLALSMLLHKPTGTLAYLGKMSTEMSSAALFINLKN